MNVGQAYLQAAGHCCSSARQMDSSQMSAVHVSEGAWLSPEQSVPEKVKVDMFLK